MSPILEIDKTYPWLGRRGQKYYVYYLDPITKKPFLKTTKQKNRRRAIEAGTKILSEYIGTPVNERLEKKVPLTFRELGETIKEELKSTPRIDTYLSFKNQFDIHLNPAMGHFYIADFTEETWVNYYYQKKAMNPSRAFFNDWKAFMKITNRAFRMGIIRNKISIPNPDKDRPKIGIVYTPEQMAKILTEARGRTVYTDIYLHILMYYRMFMRRGEQLKSRWTDYDLVLGTLVIPKENTKNKKRRHVPLDQEVWMILIQKRAKADSVWVFPHSLDKTKHKMDFRHAFKGVLEATGIKKGRPHDLRHTGLTERFRETKIGGSISTDAIKICVYAGLSVDEAMSTYLHFDAEDLREVIKVSGKPGQNQTKRLGAH